MQWWCWRLSVRIVCCKKGSPILTHCVMKSRVIVVDSVVLTELCRAKKGAPVLSLSPGPLKRTEWCLWLIASGKQIVIEAVGIVHRAEAEQSIVLQERFAVQKSPSPPPLRLVPRIRNVLCHRQPSLPYRVPTNLLLSAKSSSLLI